MSDGAFTIIMAMLIGMDDASRQELRTIIEKMRELEIVGDLQAGDALRAINIAARHGKEIIK